MTPQCSEVATVSWARAGSLVVIKRALREGKKVNHHNNRSEVE